MLSPPDDPFDCARHYERLHLPGVLDWLWQNRQLRLDANLPTHPWNRRRIHRLRYLMAAPWVHGKRVIDIASGTGYGCAEIARASAALVVGVERDPAAAMYASRFYGSASAVFVAADSRKVPFADGVFDVVTSFETLEHIEDEKQQIEEFFRLLIPRGWLILSVPNGWTLDIARDHCRVYDCHAVRRALEERFVIEEAYALNSGDPSFIFNREQNFRVVSLDEQTAETAESIWLAARRR